MNHKYPHKNNALVYECQKCKQFIKMYHAFHLFLLCSIILSGQRNWKKNLYIKYAVAWWCPFVRSFSPQPLNHFEWNLEYNFCIYNARKLLKKILKKCHRKFFMIKKLSFIIVSFCPFICPSVHPYVLLSIYTCPSVHLCMSFCPYICPSVP